MVNALKKQGMAIKAIARETGVARNTVKKYLIHNAVPCYQRATRPSKLDPFKPLFKSVSPMHILTGYRLR